MIRLIIYYGFNLSKNSFFHLLFHSQLINFSYVPSSWNDKPLLSLEKKLQEMSPGVDSTLLCHEEAGLATRHKPDSYNSLSLVDRSFVDRSSGKSKDIWSVKGKRGYENCRVCEDLDYGYRVTQCDVIYRGRL